jgi:hypothetical protein
MRPSADLGAARQLYGVARLCSVVGNTLGWINAVIVAGDFLDPATIRAIAYAFPVPRPFLAPREGAIACQADLRR